MSMYRRIIWPVLKRFDPETTHEWTLRGVEAVQGHRFGRNLLHTLRGSIPSSPVQCFGLTFPNVLGVAAGFDKDVRVARGLAELGFGHIEVGTLTPRPQVGNPKPRIFRLPQDEALINRMGFPNGGVAEALPRLRRLSQMSRDFVIGVSLGKQKETPLAEATQDYISVLRDVYECADYLVVNVSSPNTPGLRELQGEAYLAEMLGELSADIATYDHPKPLLLKIAPDLTWEQLDTILAIAEANGVAGMIATNTTIARAGLRDSNQHEKGGLSGSPLRERSNEVIRHIARNSRLPIIGVGGVRNSADVRAKFDAGATLVQVYTGFVYEGPRMAGRILRSL